MSSVNLVKQSTLTGTAYGSSKRNWNLVTANSVKKIECTTEGLHYVVPSTSTVWMSSGGIYLNLDDIGITKGDTITISADVKGTYGSNNAGLAVWHGTSTSTKYWAYADSLGGALPIDIPDWTRISGTYTIPSTFGASTMGDEIKNFLYIFFGGGRGQTSDLDGWVRNVQIEKGSIATDYQKNDDDLKLFGVIAKAQQTLVDLTDAYTVFMTSEAYTFIGNTTSAVAGQSTTTQIVAMCGTEKVPCTIGECTSPTGISVSVGTGDNPTLTISASNTFTTAGNIKIPVTIKGTDITIDKLFSVSVALTGAAGQNGKSGTSSRWFTGTTITGTSTIATVFANSGITSAYVGDMYLNTDTNAVYRCSLGGTASTATWVYQTNIKGQTGSSGADGKPSGKWYSGTAVTGTSTTATVFKSSGVANAVSGDMYLNTSTSNTYRCASGGDASTATWVFVSNIKGEKGEKGEDGEPILNLVITSSNGFIFRNTDVATVLTAHVYRAGDELTEEEIANYGKINWYKDGNTTAVASGSTLSISAGDILDRANYTARLED